MASAIESIRAALVASPSVTALIGTRVYPLVIPEGTTMPAVTLTVVSDVPENSTDGTAETRLRMLRVQADAYAETYLEAHQVADAVNLVIANLAAPTLSAQREGSEDLFDDETELFRVSSDYSVAFGP